MFHCCQMCPHLRALPLQPCQGLELCSWSHWMSSHGSLTYGQFSGIKGVVGMLGCCPYLPGHWPPRGWERLPGLAFPSLQSLSPRSISRGPFFSSTVTGAWTEWGPWDPCSVSCGGGQQRRQRSCVDPPPKNGGAPCPGPSHERALCNLQLCPGDTGNGKLAGRDVPQWSPGVCLWAFWHPSYPCSFLLRLWARPCIREC